MAEYDYFGDQNGRVQGDPGGDSGDLLPQFLDHYADIWKNGKPMWNTRENRVRSERSARKEQEAAYEYAMSKPEKRWPPRTWSEFFIEMATNRGQSRSASRSPSASSASKGKTRGKTRVKGGRRRRSVRRV
jgi:hypothetical protein